MLDFYLCEYNDYLNCGSGYFFPFQRFMRQLCVYVLLCLVNVIVQNLYGYERAIRFSVLSQGGKVTNSTKSLVSDKKRHDEKHALMHTKTACTARAQSSSTYTTNGSRAHTINHFFSVLFFSQTNRMHITKSIHIQSAIIWLYTIVNGAQRLCESVFICTELDRQIFMQRVKPEELECVTLRFIRFTFFFFFIFFCLFFSSTLFS